MPAYAAAVKPQQYCSPQHGAAGRSDEGTGPGLCNPVGIPALTPAKQRRDMHHAALKAKGKTRYQSCNTEKTLSWCDLCSLLKMNFVLMVPTSVFCTIFFFFF